MHAADRNTPRFYFALPRLCASLRGGNSERTERNWIEANIVGAAVMLISYVTVARCLLIATDGRPFVTLVAAIVLTWLLWLLFFYVNVQIIRLLRAARILRSLSNARAQSVQVGMITSVFAGYLCTGGPMLVTLGAGWIAAVCVNLAAAIALTLMRVRQ